MNTTQQSNIKKVFSNYKTSEDIITFDSFDKMNLDKDILRGIYRRNGDIFKLYTFDNLSNGKFILATGKLDMVKKTLDFKASYVE